MLANSALIAWSASKIQNHTRAPPSHLTQRLSAWCWLLVLWITTLVSALKMPVLPSNSCLNVLVSASLLAYKAPKVCELIHFSSIRPPHSRKLHTIATFATNMQQLFLISALTPCFPITSSLPVLSILTLVFISAMTIFTSLHGSCSKTIRN